MDFLWTEIKNCQKCHFRPHIDFQKWPSGLFLRIFDQNLPCLALDLTPLLDNFFRQCENFSDLREFFSNWREIFHRREFFQTCRNNVSTCHSDSAGPTWTKIGTVKQIDPGNKPLAAFLKKLQIDPTPEGQSSKFQKNFWGQTFFSFFFVNFSCWKWLKLCIISLSGSTEQPTYVKLEIKANWRVWIFSSDAPRANLTRNSCSLP